MGVELHILPEIPPMSWETFKQTHAPYSIALDGYLESAPRVDLDGPYLNADHHDDVNRDATLSSAQQILRYAALGLKKAFMYEGEFRADVYVNDCDQDVCAAWFLLSDIDRTEHASKSLRKFIQVAGTLDATAGAFPYGRDLKILPQINWVFDPYIAFRQSGEMSDNNPAQYRQVIDDVGQRIERHVAGDGESKELDTRYEVLGGGRDWKMIEEVGYDGRVGAFMDGVDSYVAVQQIDDERWRYSVGRRSQFIPFDIEGVLGALTKAENRDGKIWGGSDTIGGSPRCSDSVLSPETVERVVNEHINQKRLTRK